MVSLCFRVSQSSTQETVPDAVTENARSLKFAQIAEGVEFAASINGGSYAEFLHVSLAD